MIRVFHLLRLEDESGVSGTGVVAEGIEFSDGTCVVHWLSHTSSTNIYENIKQVDLVHGHHGKTEVKFIYEEPNDPGRIANPEGSPAKSGGETGGGDKKSKPRSKSTRKTSKSKSSD